MATDFQEFLTFENFKLAFIRLKTAPISLYKSIYLEDLKIFELFLKDNIETIIELIESGQFEPKSCNKIFTPKKEFQVRPIYMLCFVDLLVYQAMINVIGDRLLLKMSNSYNKTIYGNQINSTNDKKGSYFQFIVWKSSYKAFSNNTRKAYYDGYKFILEFDITSFFDTIDQDVLITMLCEEFSISQDILELLEKCLKKWTIDSNHKSYAGKRGIPQGPDCSACLAEAYLCYVDEEINNKSNLDIKYLRYVDDIRILSKNKINLQKAAVFLEICTRDIGLISQSSKLDIREITDIEKELKSQFNKFSIISSEYKSITESKSKNQLKIETHNKLKEEFLSCFKEDAPEDVKLNKTIIGFSLYKLNKDKEVKNCLLENYTKIIPHFEKVLFYLSTHFRNDEKVLSIIESICKDPDILYRHQLALCLKYFPNIKLDITFIEKQLNEKSRHWLLKYFLVEWLFLNNKTEILLDNFNPNDTEYFTSRKLFEIIDSCAMGNEWHKDFLIKAIESENPIISINAYRKWLLCNYGNIDGIKLNVFTDKLKKIDFSAFAYRELSGKIRKIEVLFDCVIFTEIELNETLSLYGRYLLSINFDWRDALENLLKFITRCIDKFCKYFDLPFTGEEIIRSLLSENESIILSEYQKVNKKTEDLILFVNLLLNSNDPKKMDYVQIKSLNYQVVGFLIELVFNFNLKRNYVLEYVL